MAILPVAALLILAACGSGGRKAAEARAVEGPGFMFQVPVGWHVTRSGAGVVARSGGASVSVARFSLRRPYAPSQFAAAAAELDRVAAQLAAKANARLTERRTSTVAGRRARTYAYARTRVGFVLVDTREYELLCVGQSDACTLLFSSFAVS